MNDSMAGWQHFQKWFFDFPAIGLGIDLSRSGLDDDFLKSMQPRMAAARAAMAALENGAIANPDEKRMVGHYWLRNPALAPTPAIRRDIESTIAAVKEFAAAVHAGSIKGSGGLFRNLLLIGIGGSALGPQFVSHALGQPAHDRMKLFCFDNTDPDGMDKVLAQLQGALDRTLCLVISKSGGTKETRNGMMEAQAAYAAAGLNFAAHAVAVTGDGSALDQQAIRDGWIRRFPMWDWVGGRTSETSAVGLLPAALQGIDIDQILAGAAACDAENRKSESNPAEILAISIFKTVNGVGNKDMVVLPYKDRLELFSKYLQQLIMESLGKELDLQGRVVNQGLAVYGNKGSTDQHAYVQQLREGLHNFFALFIEVQRDRSGKSILVEPDATAGDYLFGYFMGTRQALAEKGRNSITLTIPEVSPYSVGVLIALFERFVGLYAQLIGINAYHQPGVEAGKKAADAVVNAQRAIISHLRASKGSCFTIEDLSTATKVDPEIAFKICQHLAANPGSGLVKTTAATPFAARFMIA
jgi:glucose-6-phosphate isomerase